MNVIRIDENNAAKVIPLIASFRAELLSYKGTAAEPDAKRAEEELFEFLDKGYPVFAAEQDDASLWGISYAGSKTNAYGWSSSLSAAGTGGKALPRFCSARPRRSPDRWEKKQFSISFIRTTTE